MNRVGRRRQHGPDREEALGQPRALIEKTRGFVERLDIDFDDGRAQRALSRESTLVRLSRPRVAEEDALACERHAKANISRHWAATSKRTSARIGIGSIEARHGLERDAGVVDRQ
jgi:hypothetical protein